ncbi:thioredoxin family protein [uncultured Thomasclavelia sp.]|uniref:thioredoxin family protein n=1 Tax=uncultured Thomasclavelia sp. TaxID=3025759 RepID=UPI0025D578C1|nr:thioredoxin family protein [uncultured Thomasclavelia sp.]
MRKVTCFYLTECPYCIQAKKALKELIAENPLYGEVEIDWIEESQNPDIIDQYDYYATPSMFIGKEKLYEAYLFETYDECKAHVKAVLDEAMK